jgi:transcriptional antiterminator RfaH
MNQWYVIKSKPKQEKAVHGQLSRAGYEMFLPQIEGINAPKPLFPSYLFISADLEETAHHRLVRYTRGVSHILGDQRGPNPIASFVIEELKNRTRDGQLIEQELLFKEGDSVIVKRGLLKDLIGMIERHLPDQKRVEILFKWWSTSMRARLRYSDLEKAA